MSSETTFKKEQQDLWTLVRKLNNCWYNGQPSQLTDFFHDSIVFNSPDFKHQIIGKENCIQTYIDFLSTSRVLLYNEGKPTIQLFGNTAILTYDFEMKYEQKNKTYHETGIDIMVFCRQQTSWKVTWRGLSNLKNV